MSFVLGGKFVAIDAMRRGELYEKLSKKKKYVCLCQGLLLHMSWMDLVTTVSFPPFSSMFSFFRVSCHYVCDCVGPTNWGDMQMSTITSLRSSGRPLDIVLTRLRDQWHSGSDNAGMLIIQL